jgi:hypothetical protein
MAAASDENYLLFFLTFGSCSLAWDGVEITSEDIISFGDILRAWLFSCL